jgi:peptidoglycan/xylan/chitin deacetylase (PgdA/CDA1 family)
MKTLRVIRSGIPDARETMVQAVDRAWAAIARPADLVRRAPPVGRRVALSFDDGPSPANTAAVLDLLDEHDAKGTFFVVGSRIDGHEQILRRAARSGHELANHTHSHVHTVHLSCEELRRDIARANEAIASAVNGIDAPVRLVRPPFGKDRRRTTLAARELGLLTVLWSVDSGDARHFTVDEVISAVAGGATPGSIVLMHDGGQRRDTTLTALAALLPRLRAAGLQPVTVSELLGLKQ